MAQASPGSYTLKISPCGHNLLSPRDDPGCREALVSKSLAALGTGQTLGGVPVRQEGPKEATEGPLAGTRVSIVTWVGPAGPLEGRDLTSWQRAIGLALRSFRCSGAGGTQGVGLDTVALVASAEDILSREEPPGQLSWGRSSQAVGPCRLRGWEAARKQMHCRGCCWNWEEPSPQACGLGERPMTTKIFLSETEFIHGLRGATWRDLPPWTSSCVYLCVSHSPAGMLASLLLLKHKGRLPQGLCTCCAPCHFLQCSPSCRSLLKCHLLRETAPAYHIQNLHLVLPLAPFTLEVSLRGP